ncbi:MAG: O-antigen ligase family protein [Pseudomonadales bacterium]|nr:O-antigen ligase family protein [Pseudomonadales bacterium]
MNALQGFPLTITLELFCILTWAMQKKRFDAIQIKAVMLLNLFIIVSWIPFSINEGISSAIQFFVNQSLIVLLISNILDSKNKARLMLMLLVITSATMAIHGILQLADPDKTGWTGIRAMVRHDSGDEPVWQARYCGPFADPNDMGMLLASSLPILLYLYKTSSNFMQKVLWLGCGYFILQGVYIVNSRGTILAAVAPIGLYLALRYNVVKAIVPMLMALPVAIAILPSRVFISNDESSQGRIDAWYAGYQMFKSYPITGVGMGNFIDHHHKTAHNSWVLAYAELGLIGFYFWMLMMFTALYAVYHYSKKHNQEETLKLPNAEIVNQEAMMAKAIFYAFVAAMVSAFFLSRTYSILFYIYVGLCTASFYRMRDLLPEDKIKDLKVTLFLASVAFIIFIAFIVLFKS